MTSQSFQQDFGLNWSLGFTEGISYDPKLILYIIERCCVAIKGIYGSAAGASVKT